MAWTVVPVANLGASRDTAFNLGTAGTGSNGDHSWMLRIEKEASQWVFLARSVKFNFGSVSNVRYFKIKFCTAYNYWWRHRLHVIYWRL